MVELQGDPLDGEARQAGVPCLLSQAIHRLGVPEKGRIDGSEATSAAPGAVSPDCQTSCFVAAAHHSRNSML